MRKTLQDAYDFGIPKVLSLCAGDEARRIINEGQQILLNRGLWWGCYQKYRVCVSSGCLTWPRQVASILSMTVCGQPVKQRNEWFEYLENGWGMRNQDSCDGQNFNRAEGIGVCSFEDMAADGSEQIYVESSAPEADETWILLLGYDNSGRWVRFFDVDLGEWHDGEYVAISAGGAYSATKFSSLTAVQKDPSRGVVRLFKYNPDTVATTLMAVYDPDETNPSYRRTFLPGLTASDGECGTTAVTIMAKMEFIPVKNLKDFLLIGNLPALKLACMSVDKKEKGLYPEAEILMEGRMDRDGKRYGGAIQLMEQELEHYLPANIAMPVNYETSQTWGAGVANAV